MGLIVMVDGKERPAPCNFDHNGECLICDCWPSDCALQRLFNGDFKYESLDELLLMFKDHLTPDEVTKLRVKYDTRLRPKSDWIEPPSDQYPYGIK